MNAAAQTFTLAFGSVLAAAAIGVALANHTAEATAVPGVRSGLATQAEPAASAQVAHLPRVVIEQHRSAEGLQVAQTPGRRAM